ncbi:MAG TPA: DUF5302 domain-containing protein [Microlunatus sp.]|nr:DUF5302 domain-containing protein [Microlunatus sp.]
MSADHEDQAVDAAEETKRKFREALDAKKNGRRGDAHVDDGQHGHVHGHGPVDAKRTFRRKTG